MLGPALDGALRLTRLLAMAGILLLMAAMLVTVADVTLRKTGITALPGTVDIVQLLVMAAAYLTIPFAFAACRHVAVTVASDWLPSRLRAALELAAAALAAVLMIGIAWYGLAQALLEHDYGEVSQTLAIPKFYYWLPLLVGAAASAAVSMLIAAARLVHAVTGTDPVR